MVLVLIDIFFGNTLKENNLDIELTLVTLSREVIAAFVFWRAFDSAPFWGKATGTRLQSKPLLAWVLRGTESGQKPYTCSQETWKFLNRSKGLCLQQGVFRSSHPVPEHFLHFYLVKSLFWNLLQPPKHISTYNLCCSSQVQQNNNKSNKIIKSYNFNSSTWFFLDPRKYK